MGRIAFFAQGSNFKEIKSQTWIQQTINLGGHND